MVRKVDLDENAHALTILQRLDRLKRDQRQCDFIVSVDGDEFVAHRNILSVGSNYFNAMLTHDTKESQLGKVEMLDVDSECVRICVDYIYTGKADIPDEKMLALMHASHLMQLDELFEGIVALFEKELNIDTFYETKKVAELYSLGNLLAKCKEFADKNFGLISSRPDFLDQPEKFVIDVISSKNISTTEKEKLIISLKWTRHDPERAKYLIDFVRTIDLKEVSLSYKRHLVENESLIMENPQLLQIFYASIMDGMEIRSRNEEEFYDNKVVIIFDKDLDGLQSFNMQDEEMKKFRDESFNRFPMFSAVSVRAHIYVLSKNKSVHRLSIADEKAKWEKMENTMEDHGWHPPAVSHDGSLYVIGGQHDCCTAVSEQYLPDESKWAKLKNLPNATQYATVVSLGEYIYNVGGFRDGRFLDTFLKFSPSNSEWTYLPPMMKPKCSCGVTAINQRIYVLGGFGGEAYLTEVNCFDVVTSQWISLSPMIESRCAFQAFCINKLIYVFGGDAGDKRRLIEKYDTETDSWAKVKQLDKIERMVRKVDLDEKDHALRILQRLDQMKKDQRQCDFIVSADSAEIHTHRNILSAGSDYFNAMLTHDTKESQLGKVEMIDVDPECVDICLTYIYSGKAEIPDGKILALMHVAHLMQLDKLFEAIVTLFENELNADSFYETKEVAELYGLENLLAKCKKFADENFELITSQPDFLNQPKKFVFDTIGSKNLSATEKEKLIVSLKWTRHDPERAKHFPDFVQTINLKKISVHYRRYLVEKESLVIKNPQLLQIFYSSLLDSMGVQSRNEEYFDSKVVIIFDENVVGLQSFNMQNEEMKKFHDRDIKRFWVFSAASLHSHIYVLSKDKSVQRLNIADEKATWEKVENTIEYHGSTPPVVSCDGSLYVIGGSYHCCTSVSEQYLPDKNKWVKVKNLPNAIQYPKLVNLDQYIYCAGGLRDERSLGTFLRFSPSRSEWTHLPPMKKAKRNCGVAAANQKIYLMGGYDGKFYLSEVNCFDVVTSQWMSLAPMLESRTSFQAFCIDKSIYVFGGSDVGIKSKLIEKYDIERDSWTTVKIPGFTPSIIYAVLP